MGNVADAPRVPYRPLDRLLNPKGIKVLRRRGVEIMTVTATQIETPATNDPACRPRVAVLIPYYNEEAAVAQVVSTFSRGTAGIGDLCLRQQFT